MELRWSVICIVGSEVEFFGGYWEFFAVLARDDSFGVDKSLAKKS